MRKMISCLAILTMLASMVSCGITESGGISDNTVPTKAAVTTTVAETSKDEKTTTASNGAEKSKDTTKNDTSANDETNSTLILKEEDRLFGAYVDTQGDVLNLRNEPSPTADIIDAIPDQTQIDIYSCGKAGWYCTSYNGKSGYVSAVYIKEIQDYVPQENTQELITDISELVGQWKYQIAPEGKNITVGAIDNGTIDVKSDGTYIYTDLDGNTHSGTVKVDYDTLGGDYRVPFFAFYEGDKFFISCYCQQNNPNAYLIGNGGMGQLLSVNADFSAIAGEWEELNGDGRVFDISANGTYTVTYPNNSTEQGFIKIGNEIFSENSDGKWYNFYNSSGMAWIGFPKTDSGTVDELKAGDFTLRRRKNDIVDQEQAEDERIADKSEIAAARMKDFNAIMALLNASPQYTTEDSAVEGYAKVTDSRFKSIANVKNFISATCTGLLENNLLRECDNCLIEKDSSIYVKHAYHSFYQFRTEKGVTVTDPAMNYFSAITNEDDDLFGYGKATFSYHEGRWRIKNYEFGDLK